MQSTPSLPLLPGTSPGVLAFDRVLNIGQIEQAVCKQMTDVKLSLLYINICNRLIALVGRVLANGSGTGVQSQVGSYQRL